MQSSVELNKLNRDFYERCGRYWNNTAEYEWAGWSEITDFFLQKSEFSVLDLGAGSGRFGHFLGRQFPNSANYMAVDFADFYVQHMQKSTFNFIRSQKIIQKDLFCERWKFNKTFDVVVAFGLIHHLSSDRRNDFFRELATVFNQDTVGIITTWQYLDSKRLRKKIISEKSAKLKPYGHILNWTQGEYGERYSYHWPINEVIDIGEQYGFTVEFLDRPSGLENYINHYFLIKKA